MLLSKIASTFHLVSTIIFWSADTGSLFAPYSGTPLRPVLSSVVAPFPNNGHVRIRETCDHAAIRLEFDTSISFAQYLIS